MEKTFVRSAYHYGRDLIARTVRASNRVPTVRNRSNIILREETRAKPVVLISKRERFLRCARRCARPINEHLVCKVVTLFTPNNGGLLKTVASFPPLRRAVIGFLIDDELKLTYLPITNDEI